MSDSVLFHVLRFWMAKMLISYCIIIQRAAAMWKLQHMLKFATKMPLSCKNDFCNVSPLCDVSRDIVDMFDTTDVWDIIVFESLKSICDCPLLYKFGVDILFAS